jgi:hypothetical protein
MAIINHGKIILGQIGKRVPALETWHQLVTGDPIVVDLDDATVLPSLSK